MHESQPVRWPQEIRSRAGLKNMTNLVPKTVIGVFGLVVNIFDITCHEDGLGLRGALPFRNIIAVLYPLASSVRDNTVFRYLHHTFSYHIFKRISDFPKSPFISADFPKSPFIPAGFRWSLEDGSTKPERDIVATTSCAQHESGCESSSWQEYPRGGVRAADTVAPWRSCGPSSKQQNFADFATLVLGHC